MTEAYYSYYDPDTEFYILSDYNIALDEDIILPFKWDVKFFVQFRDNKKSYKQRDFTESFL